MPHSLPLISASALVRMLMVIFLPLSPGVLPAAYTLVWSDEFTQPDGSPPDPANWTYDTGGWGWGNDEEQYYTTSTNNARIENGQLVIELREDTVNAYPGNDYTSARLKTLGLQQWTYGLIEARIRLPFGDASGLWPAFWMLGTDFPVIGWPNCGEIDIMEYLSREPDLVFGTIHGPGYSGGASFGNTYNYGGPLAPPEPPLLANPYDDAYYHVYSVEWEPNRIRWYIDGILYHDAVPADVSPDPWVFDHDFFIILNLAIGGNFGGAINAANLVFPTQMLVDWVRVYQNDSYGPHLQLTKTGTFNDENLNGYADPGETISYSFTVANTGTVPLTDVTVSDPLVTVDASFPPPASLLANGGLESGSLTGWLGGTGVVTSPKQGGSHSLQLNAPGGYVVPAAFQVAAASPGDEFHFSGWMYTPTTLSAGTTGLLKMVFEDSGGNDLVPAAYVVGGPSGAPQFPGAESTPKLTSASPAGAWVYSEVQAVAPAGTVQVLFFLLNVDEIATTMYFDTLEATHVNAVPSLDLAVNAVDNAVFRATYTITAADINAGRVINTATADCAEGAQHSDTETTLLPVDLAIDPDGDGFINLFERAFGLDIFTPDPLSQGPAGAVVEASGQNYLQLGYRQRSGGTGTTGVDYTADGYSYTVEVSDDLGNWQSGTLLVQQIGPPADNGDGTETVTVRALAPVAPGASRFMRLKVDTAP